MRGAQAFLGLFTVLGRLALRPGPIGTLGLGRLARGTEPEPMVPTVYKYDMASSEIYEDFHLLLSFLLLMKAGVFLIFLLMTRKTQGL